MTDFGADARQVAKPIVPANAGDIGDRLILVPQQTHPNASEEEIRDIIVDLAAMRNVAVIVPSAARAAYWADDSTMILNKDNLAAGVERMRADPASGLYVFVNRYDGVDLPGDACHVLVIDGLPEALDGIERADAAWLSGTSLLTARQVQRLEQGMGRATRSNRGLLRRIPTRRAARRAPPRPGRPRELLPGHEGADRAVGGSRSASSREPT